MPKSDLIEMHTFYFLLGKRKRFNQTSILRHLKAKCEYRNCGKRISDVVELVIDHKNHNNADADWKNMKVCCTEHHDKHHGHINKKLLR